LESSEKGPNELNVIFKDPTSRSLVNATAIQTKLVAGDKLFSALRVFDLDKPSPLPGFSYTLSMIPRVYTTGFNAFWDEKDPQDRQISCVAVNGQVVAFNPVSEHDTELEVLKQNLAIEHNIPASNAIDTIMERLDRPFLDKITGKGFLSVYKPFFDFDENREKLIDCDIEELSRSSGSGILL
ncbi:hypothetical protein METBIDRAFT_37804, partial [Metschnikowia bicuspidata var. bicuspidata NRRL YB-4993]